MSNQKLKTVPKTLSILGQTIDIVQISMSEDSHGEADLDNHRIVLNEKYKDTNKVTLIHELIHAAIGISGISEILTKKQEEAICRCLEYALLDYIKFDGEV